MKAADRQLDRELEQFLAHHPDGWSHDDWTELLHELGQKGIDTDEADEIGLMLERRRVVAELARRGIKGLGPKRREAVAEHFTTWWNLSRASETELGEVNGLPADLANKIRTAVH